MLVVRRFVSGIAVPENVYNCGHGIRKGECLKVPKIPWELRLDGLDGDAGQFSVVQCADAKREPKVATGGTSVEKGEASFWDSVEASQLPADWKKRLRSFVENAVNIPGCEVSWHKGALVNLPGVVPQKALVGVRRDGTLEVYLARWRSLGNSPLTPGQQKRVFGGICGLLGASRAGLCPFEHTA